MSAALQQFVGARVESIRAIDDESVVIRLVLPDGMDRTIEIYHAHHEPIAVRIDGGYVPPEEL